MMEFGKLIFSYRTCPAPTILSSSCDVVVFTLRANAAGPCWIVVGFGPSRRFSAHAHLCVKALTETQNTTPGRGKFITRSLKEGALLALCWRLTPVGLSSVK